LSNIDIVAIDRERRADLTLRIFHDLGALLTGHFVLKSGLHSGTYLNKDTIYPHVQHIRAIGRMIADEVHNHGWPPIEIVAAPEKGGIILSQWTAAALSLDPLLALPGTEPPLAVYAEKQPDGGFAFSRGYGKLLCGKRVLVVDDIATTGGSVFAAEKAVIQNEGIIVGVMVVVDRSGRSLVPSLAQVNIPTWSPIECPLCQTCVPINTDVGHGGGRK